MSYKLTKKFVETLGGSHAYTHRGLFSPLLFMFPWSLDENPLPTFSINKGRDSFIAINERNYFEIAIKKFRLYYKKEISLKDLQNDYNSFAFDVKKFYDKIVNTTLATLSIEEIMSLLEEIKNLLRDLSRTIYIESLDYDKVLQVIGQDKKAIIDRIWEDATHPTFISFEARRLKYLIDLVSSGDKNFVRKAKYIFTDYYWTKDEKEISQHLNEIKNNLETKKKEYGEFVEKTKERKGKFDRWISDLNEEAKHIVKYIQLVMYFRDVRKDAIAQLHAVMCELSEEILRRAEIDQKYAPVILLFEYIKGIEYLKAQQKNIEKRTNGFMAMVNTDYSYEIELCDFDAALKEFDDLIFGSGASMKSVKGQVANRGKVTGIARVVLDPHNTENFNEGDILVTSMTRPEFMHLMKKAAAFVTNEGGITCHAAIVAREMRKPCIIATKIATKVLKDGDMVEVDADKGVVKIIS